MYSKELFANELRNQIAKGFDLQRISTWADDTFFLHQRELEKGLYEYFMRVLMMEMGSEFVLTEQELLEMANELSGDST